MAQYDFDIGVIGGGAAGLTVTSGAAQLGAKTILIEKEPVLGGDCLHFGCVPSKTLIRTAHVYHLLKNARKFGLPEISVPPVDFRDVAQRIKSVIDVIQKHDSAERFCKLGARVEFGDPVFSDSHSVGLNGKSFSARKWVIATGSSPAVPPIEGLGETAYLTNREIFSLEQLPASLIILGGGPIAIEMAQAFNRLGTNVTVVQRSGQILSREDKDMADMVMEILQREGVVFRLNSSIMGTRDLGDKKEVDIRRGAEDNVISLQADALLVAMGRSANTAGLGLEKIEVSFDRKGIKVDKRLRTSRKHIFAAGDVNGAYQFTHAAGYEGGIVIGNAVFHLPRKVNYTFMPHCTYTDPEFAGIGMNEKSAAAQGLEYSVWTEEFSENDRGQAEANTTGRIKLILDAHEKPVGVHVIGPHAGELLSEWVAVLNGGIKLSTVASAVHPYPTLGEINKKVVSNFLSTKIFSEKIQKGLKLFFGFKGRACG